jgi:hypothetical protein
MDPRFWQRKLEEALPLVPAGKTPADLALEVARIIEHAVRLTSDSAGNTDLQARIDRAKAVYGFDEAWIDTWISWYRLLYFRTEQHGQDLLDWLHRVSPSGPDGAAIRPQAA